ncbi:MAG: GNAT family N-acetyltransferase [Actinomycetes bacterium]
MSIFQLRTLDFEDMAWIFEACQDESIQRWTMVPRPYSLEDAEWFIEEDPEYVTMVIEDPESLTPLGLVSIHKIDQVTGEADIGYWVAPWGRGMGVAVSGIRMLIAAIKPEEGIQSLVAYVAQDNIASCKTIERAGFIEVERGWGMAREFLNEVMSIKYQRMLP